MMVFDKTNCRKKGCDIMRRRKTNYTLTFVALLFIGVIGVMLIIHGHNSEIANANKDVEAISQNVDTTQQPDIQGQTDEQGQADEDIQSGQSNDNNDSSQDGQASVDNGQQTNQDTSISEGSDDDSTEQNAQTNSPDEGIIDNSGHNDINMEEMIALVGEDVYNFDSTKVVTVSNPSSLYVLVNKLNDLPSDYVPELVVSNVDFSFSGDSPKKQMRPEAAAALEQLLQAAKDSGHEIFACSGYRSYNTQNSLFQNYASSNGEEAANKYSARPGQSEHQTGLAMDLTSQSVGLGLEDTFGDTPEGKWLDEHAHEYGFIIRYPKGKEDITLYNYEPWHVRYVGKELATYLYENNLTLDEFYENIANSK